MVDYQGPPVPSVLPRILFAAILGIPAFASVTLAAERGKWGKAASVGALAVVAGLLTAYGWTVPLDLEHVPAYQPIRLVMFAAALHFLVAVAPYLGGRPSPGFWQYNRTFALRFLTSGIFSGVLFGGLAIALAALNNLFGIEVADRRYGELWVLLAGMFSTSFFFSGVPEDLDALDAVTDYPGVVRIFSQYILLPLVLVYAVILYAYAGKILIEWSWPRGWVGGLILGYGTTGILMTLLVHPLRESADHAWIRRTASWFYISLAPLVVMLVLAVLRRVSEYGFTEGRYVALVLGVWMGLASLYYVFSGTKDIRVIPASLCVVAFLSAMGPWSAFSVSESSQVERLRVILVGRGMLSDGKIVKPSSPVAVVERQQMSSILAYLSGAHGLEAIQPWFGESLREDSSAPVTRYKSPTVVARMIGFEYVVGSDNEAETMVTLEADRTGSISVAGFEGLIRNRQIYRGGREFEDAASGHVRVRASEELDSITVAGLIGGSPVDSVTVALRPLIDSLLVEYGNMSAHELAQEKLSIEGRSPGVAIRVYFPRMTIEKTDKGPKLLSYEAEILYSVRREQ
jgi:hypothetical protein